MQENAKEDKNARPETLKICVHNASHNTGYIQQSKLVNKSLQTA